MCVGDAWVLCVRVRARSLVWCVCVVSVCLCHVRVCVLFVRVCCVRVCSVHVC